MSYAGREIKIIKVYSRAKNKNQKNLRSGTKHKLIGPPHGMQGKFVFWVTGEDGSPTPILKWEFKFLSKRTKF